MKVHLFVISFATLLGVTTRSFAVDPPMPGMTNGDGIVAHNGMKHANVSLAGTVVDVQVDATPPTPVTMMSGFGTDYTPAKFDVLENSYFNAQYGWMLSGIASPPSGSSVWIKRTNATQPAGSAFHVYEAGMGMEMAMWTMNEIYASDGALWQWDGMMQHDYYTADRPGVYSMSFEVYVGDSMGMPLAGYTHGAATFQFTAVPEPGTAVLMLCGLLCLGLRRR
ncbi:MAG: PEP-CTERM sorting domain-containing protein [Pirellulales bacterium]|nr:PEP-CTERM sorting domain-containing protein [Pirellulales bacterium]